MKKSKVAHPSNASLDKEAKSAAKELSTLRIATAKRILKHSGRGNPPVPGDEK